jgi:hypothetical protein
MHVLRTLLAVAALFSGHAHTGSEQHSPHTHTHVEVEHKRTVAARAQ